jgi:hypothetical protein
MYVHVVHVIVVVCTVDVLDIHTPATATYCRCGGHGPGNTTKV